TATRWPACSCPTPRRDERTTPRASPELGEDDRHGGLEVGVLGREAVLHRLQHLEERQGVAAQDEQVRAGVERLVAQAADLAVDAQELLLLGVVLRPVLGLHGEAKPGVR